MEVFLTGYSGLLGKAVAGRLVYDGHVVRVLMHAKAIDRRDKQEGVTFRWGGLSRQDEFDEYVSGADAVVHCAWESRKYPEERFELINVEGSARLFEAAERQGVRTFVHISSVAVYGLKDPLDQAPFTEESPFVQEAEALDEYPWAKVRVEQALRERAIGSSTRLVIIRPGLLFSDEKAPTRRQLTVLGRRVGMLIGGGKNRLPLIHVSDVADLISRALENPSAADILNAVPSIPVEARRFVRSWGDVNGQPLSVLRLPPIVAKTAGLAGYHLKRALRRKAFRPNTRYQIRSARRDILYSSEAARGRLGWTDTATRRIAECEKAS